MKTFRNFLWQLPGRLVIARWAPIPLRLIVGFGFMQHGFAKLSNGPDAFAGILQVMVYPHHISWPGPPYWWNYSGDAQ